MRQGQNTEPLSCDDVAVVKLLLIHGFRHKRIAALMDCNQGRISEINSGAKHREVPPLYHKIAGNDLQYPLLKRGET